LTDPAVAVPAQAGPTAVNGRRERAGYRNAETVRYLCGAAAVEAGGADRAQLVRIAYESALVSPGR
jgi:hypothetical protein